MVGKRFVAIAAIVHPGGIHAGHKAGPARRADGALAVGVCKSHAVGDQRIDGRRVDVRIAKGSNRVETLLIGAVPEDVRPHGIGGI